MTRIPRYGVLEQTLSIDGIAVHVERLRVDGWTIVPSTLSRDEVREIRKTLLACLDRQAVRTGGRDVLERIGEADTLRAPLLEHETFLDAARDPTVLAVVARLLGDYFILSQQNGVVARPGNDHHQAAYHRDLPYQHFTTSRSIAVNALLCLDDFTADRGSTRLLPGTHKMESFPSDAYIERQEMASEVSAGCYLMFDSMVYHRGGTNIEQEPRCALNNLYSIPILKQQISLPRALDGKWADDPELARFLGYETEAADSVADYHRRRAARNS